MGYHKPWPFNFKGTMVMAACIVLAMAVGGIVDFLGIYPGATWLGPFAGSLVGWFITYRSPKYWSEARRREKETEAGLNEQINEMRSEAMRRQPVATIGCTILYFAVFIGLLALFMFWMYRSS